MTRTILDVEEEKILFINEFLLDLCQEIEPDLEIKELSQKVGLMCIQMPNEQCHYIFREKIPLLVIDLKLLIDGT